MKDVCVRTVSYENKNGGDVVNERVWYVANNMLWMCKCLSVFSEVGRYFIETFVECLEGVFIDLESVVDSIYVFELFSESGEAPVCVVSEIPCVMSGFWIFASRYKFFDWWV